MNHRTLTMTNLLNLTHSNCRRALVREIRTPRSVGTGGGRPPPVTRWVWKRSHARTSEAPPDERGGYRYVRPTATAPHSDSTNPPHSSIAGVSAGQRRFGPFGCPRVNESNRP